MIRRCLTQATSFRTATYLQKRCLQVLRLDDVGDSNEEQRKRQIRGLAEAFALKELQPHSALWDATSYFPTDVLRAAAQLGFAGLYVAEDVGGCALSRSEAADIFSILAYGDVSATAYLTIHNMVSHCIDRHGTEAQRQAYLPSLTTMERLASYCLTEPNSGSDAASLSTSARKDGQDYVITGTKAFISGGGVSDVYLVMARTGTPESGGISAFLVDKGSAGLTFGQREKKMGWRSQPTTAVMLDGVRVPAANRLGPEGTGFKIALSAQRGTFGQVVDGGRINIGACSVGGAAFGLDYAQEYAASRYQFGKPLKSFQSMQFKLADMATQLRASQLMVRSAAQALDGAFPSATLQAAMAKRFATDACFGIVNDALQVLGGYGYLSDFPVERLVRDLRVHSILEGTNEVMRLIIARELQRS